MAKTGFTGILPELNHRLREPGVAERLARRSPGVDLVIPARFFNEFALSAARSMPRRRWSIRSGRSGRAWPALPLSAGSVAGRGGTRQSIAGGGHRDGYRGGYRGDWPPGWPGEALAEEPGPDERPSKALSGFSAGDGDGGWRSRTDIFEEPLIFEKDQAGTARPVSICRRRPKSPEPARRPEACLPARRSACRVSAEPHGGATLHPPQPEANYGHRFTAIYPLGSCTMKHNPRLNEKLARLPGFRRHPPAAAALHRTGRPGTDRTAWPIG